MATDEIVPYNKNIKTKGGKNRWTIFYQLKTFKRFMETKIT